MGRPRVHDEETRATLRAMAEQLVAEGGAAAFSVRAVAERAGTSTRAVYSLFGSKDGLLVDALAKDAYAFLVDGMNNVPETDDPARVLVELGSTSVRDAAVAFNALCEGLANSELRGAILRMLPAGEEERAWRDSLTALVRGFNVR